MEDLNPGQAADTGASPPPPGQSDYQADSGASPAPGSGAPSPSASPESPNIRQLREQYESLKGQFEPYKSLGDLDDVRTQIAIAQRLGERAVELGTGLGYTEREIREALQTDPEGTIAFLKSKASEAAASGQQPDISRTIQQELDRRLRPIQEREEARLDQEANYRFAQAFDAHTKTLFKDQELPAEEREILRQVASEMFSYDKAAFQRLRAEGKTSDVGRYVDQARAFLDKYYLARSQRETKRVGAPRAPGAPPQQAKRFSLDDIIDNPAVLGNKYA